jgi:hypothetical protein
MLNNDIGNLQIDVNRIVEWAFEIEVIINRTKSKAICFTEAQVTEPLSYTLRNIVLPEALVRPIVHFGEVCSDPYREGQINALDRVQNICTSQN